DMGMSRLAPGAGCAHVAARLVLPRQCFEHGGARHFAREHFADAFERTPAPGDSVIGPGLRRLSPRDVSLAGTPGHGVIPLSIVAVVASRRRQAVVLFFRRDGIIRWR